MVLAIEAVWDDPDMLEIRVAASNGAFAGQTHVYVALGDLAVAAEHLSGFPINSGDERRVHWGSDSNASRAGRADLLFRCRDAAGHLFLIAELTSSDIGPTPPAQTVRLELPFEAAGLDRFVDALRVVERTRRGVAILEGAP